jgi:nitroreductase
MTRPISNPVIETIKSRRAVRAFRPDPVLKEILEAIVDAGNWAPSGGNRQPWRFVIVEDSTMRHRLRDAAYPYWQEEFSRDEFPQPFKHLVEEMYVRCVGWEFQPFDQLRPQIAAWKDAVYYDAPVVIFVVGGEGPTTNLDCSMVCMNMMLAAHAMGVGSIWVSHGLLGLKDPSIKADLGIQDEEQVFGPILIGYPKIVPSPPEKAPPQVTWI